MKSDDIRTLVARRPFEPFVMVMTSGESIKVSHPENVWVRDGLSAVAREKNGSEVVTLFYPDEIVSADIVKSRRKASRRS